MKPIGYFSSANENKTLPLNLKEEDAMKYIANYFKEASKESKLDLIEEALLCDPKGTIKWLAQYL